MRPSASKAPRGATTELGNIPAPIGGINTVDGGSRLPDADCIFAYNLLASEHGLKTRLGYREWCTNLGAPSGVAAWVTLTAYAVGDYVTNAGRVYICTDAPALALSGVTGPTGMGSDIADGGLTWDYACEIEVRTLMPFTGNAANGAGNKLFACTSSGIWDATDASASPTQVVPFTYTGTSAGLGSYVNFSTSGGRFLVYCDEENGLFIWSEDSASWVVMDVDTREAWTAQTSYFVGNLIVNGGNVYECVTEGVSDATSGPTGATAGITDGTVVWDYVGLEDATAIGPSLADQNLGYTLAPQSFVHVTVWKSRLWFVERSTSRAWYLDVNSIYGVATSFDFGGRMRNGGPLRGLYNWSYDGGSGMDTSLVGISSSGDVVIYQGTNPNSASTFGLKGVWSVGGVPAGRAIATDFGGDLLVLSLVGVVPLSRLVSGTDESVADVYATRKIGNLFNQLALERRSLMGWGIHIHPTDNALVVTVPQAGGATEQLVMSFGTRGWTRYRDLPVMSGCVYEGDFYFGTSDGRVCRNEGSVDNVTLTASSPTEIQWSLLTAYRDLGTMRHKQVHLIRPTIISGTGNPIMECHARYDWNLDEVAAPTGSLAEGWDYGDWDSEIWGGEFTTNAPMGGAFGLGRAVAIAARGKSVSRTIIIGFDVLFEQGGAL